MDSTMLDLEVTPLAGGPAWPEGGREPRHVSFSYPVAPAKWTAADLRAVMTVAARLVPSSSQVPVFRSVSWSDDGGFELELSVGDGNEFAATVRAEQGASREAHREGGVRWSLLCGHRSALDLRPQGAHVR